MPLSIGFIGTGVIAASMVRAIALDGHRIFVSERSHHLSSALTQEFPAVSVGSNQQVVDAADVVILCLMDSVARTLLPTLTFRPDQRVFSAMARVSNSELLDLCAPAELGGTLIPFAFIAQGNSPVLTLPSDDQSHQVLQEVFGKKNRLFRLADADQFAAMLAAQAVILPTLTRLRNTVQWANDRGVDPCIAEGFLRQLVGGFLLSAPIDEPHLRAMAQSLGTQGGLNATLDAIFDANNDASVLTRGLDQLRQSI